MRSYSGGFALTALRMASVAMASAQVIRDALVSLYGYWQHGDVRPVDMTYYDLGLLAMHVDSERGELNAEFGAPGAAGLLAPTLEYSKGGFRGRWIM